MELRVGVTKSTLSSLEVELIANQKEFLSTKEEFQVEKDKSAKLEEELKLKSMEKEQLQLALRIANDKRMQTKETIMQFLTQPLALPTTSSTIDDAKK